MTYHPPQRSLDLALKIEPLSIFNELLQLEVLAAHLPPQPVLPSLSRLLLVLQVQLLLPLVVLPPATLRFESTHSSFQVLQHHIHLLLRVRHIMRCNNILYVRGFSTGCTALARVLKRVLYSIQYQLKSIKPNSNLMLSLTVI